jgi:hypothetical protein
MEHLFSWFILLVLVGAAIYAMFAIKKEKTSFLDECYLIQWGSLTLPVPRWWSIAKQNEHEITFERSDTRYDWKARFIHVTSSEVLTDALQKKVEAEDIYYDQDDVVIETDSRVLISDSATAEHFSEILRVEGKATQNQIERIYLDLVFMRGKNETDYFIFESKSSVLNGILEGPFFEESLKHLKLT